jgi:hypothetical protein
MARDAMHLPEVHTMSEVIDLALDRLTRAERLRRDVAAYGRTPPADVDVALAELPVTFDLDDDDVDYGSDDRTGHR